MNKKDSGGGGGAGGISPSEMFEEVPIDKLGDVSRFADKAAAMMRNLKDAAKDALAALSRLWNEGLALLGNFA